MTSVVFRLSERIEVSKPNEIAPISINSEESHRDSAEILSRKGNEGKRSSDPHSCCICKKVFFRRRAVKHHLEKSHLKTVEMLCDLCPKVFYMENAFIRHMRTAHGKKKFACDNCNYKTADKSNLRDHKLTHASRTECPVCSKRVASLRIHMQYHKPKVPCSICQIEVLPRCVRRHMKTHKVQKCVDCGENFESSEDLRR